MLDFFEPILVERINQKITKRQASLISPDNFGSWNSTLPYLSSVQLQISCVVRSIIKNHYFSDGNKRTATIVLVSLCLTFGLKKPKKNIDVEILKIAEGNYSIEQVCSILFKNEKRD